MTKGLRHVLAGLALLLAFGSAGAAAACEDYTALAADEIRVLRDTLTARQADPLDRLFAFEALACSDNPTIRAYAIRTGLETSSDPILRQRILLEAMLEKSRFDVQLSDQGDLTRDDKAFIKEHAGVWSILPVFRSPESGCISLRSQNSCVFGSSFFIKGDAVELTFFDLIGQFRLTPDNRLEGFIRVRASERYGRIPATIDLF